MHSDRTKITTRELLRRMAKDMAKPALTFSSMFIAINFGYVGFQSLTVPYVVAMGIIAVAFFGVLGTIAYRRHLINMWLSSPYGRLVLPKAIAEQHLKDDLLGAEAKRLKRQYAYLQDEFYNLVEDVTLPRLTTVNGLRTILADFLMSPAVRDWQRSVNTFHRETKEILGQGSKPKAA